MSAKDAKQRHPWRENIEAMTVAIVMAVMFKYFALEAYQIPTGSMQPTLMGYDFPPEPPNAKKSWWVAALDRVFGAGGSIKDRILVDKLSFHYRDPDRWEVVIFKYPLNRAQNFVKRLVGMPNEQLRIENGDLWTRKTSSEPWQHLRRTEAVIDAQLRELDGREPRDGVYWAIDPPSAGTNTKHACSIRGDAKLRFAANGPGPILDSYGHGYSAGMQPYPAPHPKSDRNEVGDLRAAGCIEASSTLESFAIELRESGRSYHFEIPGPAAEGNATPRVSSQARDGGPSPVADRTAGAYRLPAGEWVEFRAQNIDDVLSLAIDGEIVAELDVPPCDGERRESAVFLHVRGGAAELDDLRVWRDIHYTSADNGEREWVLGNDHYFMLGDNTQDSSDSREWKSIELAWHSMPEASRSLIGNLRGTRGYANNPPDANPIDRRFEDDNFTFFRDLHGELWIFPRAEEMQLPGERVRVEEAPFVPRRLITGRAVAVFWPLSLKYATARLKWVR